VFGGVLERARLVLFYLELFEVEFGLTEFMLVTERLKLCMCGHPVAPNEG
jgi:hypothetical protein